MSNDTQSSQPVQARVTANILARLRGDDPGLLVLGILFLVLTLASLGFESSSPTILSKICTIGGMGGLSTILVRWYQLGSNRLRSEGVPVTVDASNESVTVCTTVQNPRDAISLVRAVVQGRKALPPPHGKVNGNPRQTDALSEYTDEERDHISKVIRTEVVEHDKKVLRQLDEIERQLSLPSASNDLELPPQSSMGDEGSNPDKSS